MEVGRKTIYNNSFEGRKDIILWHVLDIKPDQLIKINFISKNSKNRQGIRLAIDVGEGYIEINGQRNKGFELWEDTAPKEFTARCVTKEGLISVYNIWDKGKGRQSQILTSGMILETNGNKYTYHCNDFGFDTNFDKLIFSVEKL